MTTSLIKRKNGHTSELTSLFDDLLNENNWFWGNNRSLKTFPAVNISENDDQYMIDLVSPGCKKEDFKISLENNYLTVSFEHEEKNETNFLSKEYSKTSFTKRFTVDNTVDISKIDASYNEGILKIVLPKLEKLKPQTKLINIK